MLKRTLMTTCLLMATLSADGVPVRANPIPAIQSAVNMHVIGHSDLNGAGRGGERLALHQYPDGRRVLFLAHESEPMCVSLIHVTHLEVPQVLTRISVSALHLRCNSLGRSGIILAVAHQIDKRVQNGAGMEVFSVVEPAHPRRVSIFDICGPLSRGVHYLWFVDGRHAYLSSAPGTPHARSARRRIRHGG